MGTGITKIRKQDTRRRLGQYLRDYRFNIIMCAVELCAMVIAVAILYHALLQFSHVSGTSLAGLYASEYDHAHDSDAADPFFEPDKYMRGYSFFLCNGEGKIVYHDMERETSEAELRPYIDSILELIRSGKLQEYDDYIIDMDGAKRGVYHAATADGGMSIITVPYSEIFRSLRIYIYIFSFITVIFFAGNIAAVRSSLKERRSNERLMSTIRALSNTYYGLYRVNYADNTYELVRGSHHVRSRMPDRGNYEDFLRISGAVVEEKAFEEFCDSFSLENIRHLIENRVRDFGGDFLRNFDGEYRWVNVSLRFDESLDKDEVLLCFREVNEQKKKQLHERQVMKEALEMADQNMRSKQSFFNNMSHDMRTPLNAILGMTELAKGRLCGTDPEESRASAKQDDPAAGTAKSVSESDIERVRYYLDKIDFSGRQLLTLINDILDMSRSEQGALAFNERPFSMSGTLKAAIEGFKVQAVSQGKYFIEDIRDDDVPVMGDPDRIVQIINNLVSNAVKFTRKGDSISVGLKFEETLEGISFRIKVADTGLGMSEDFLPHLFEPYYRENRFQSQTSIGTGLGMPIVNNLIKYMNGEINVKSEVDKGTVFRIVLVLPRAEEMINPGTDSGSVLKPEESEGGSAKKDARETASGAEGTDIISGAKVLLCEDNEINMEIAKEILQSFGAEVYEARNGREALNIFKDSEEYFYDMILMDMQMPVMDGCEASSRIRKLDRRDSRTIPIIAVTANAFAEDIAAQKASGMDDSVFKPIDFRVLREKLEKYLSIRRRG
ncbi:MAG TPA: response regulator [Candidatus Avilachnospira avistercoris]|nr:response regulator [Candidatus Avilachnospira avistercoris]